MIGKSLSGVVYCKDKMEKINSLSEGYEVTAKDFDYGKVAFIYLMFCTVLTKVQAYGEKKLNQKGFRKEAL